MEIDQGDRMVTDQDEEIMDYEEEVEMGGLVEEDAVMEDEEAGEGENDHDMDAEPEATALPSGTTIPIPAVATTPPITVVPAVPSFFPPVGIATTSSSSATIPSPVVGGIGLGSQPLASPPAPETDMTPVNEEPGTGVSEPESKRDEMTVPLIPEPGGPSLATTTPIALPTSNLPTASSSPAPQSATIQETSASAPGTSEAEAGSSTMQTSDTRRQVDSSTSTDVSTSIPSNGLDVTSTVDNSISSAAVIVDGDGEEKAVEAAETADEEEEYYEDEEDVIQSHTLPPICLHLPGLGARALFSSLPKDELDMDLPVWLKDRQEELAVATLAEALGAIREELKTEKMDKGGELILVEKQMELRMGEDDKNLQTVTLLEFLQVHHDCGLPLPVQLYLVFEPSRFIARFRAIKTEVEGRRESTASEEGHEEAVQDEAVRDEVVQQTAEKIGNPGSDREESDQEKEAAAEDEAEYEEAYPEPDADEGEQDARAENDAQADEELQESRPRVPVETQTRYAGSEPNRDRPAAADWAHAHGDSGPVMDFPRSTRIIVHRSRSPEPQDEPKAKRVRSKRGGVLSDGPPGDDTPKDDEDNGDESGEREDRDARPVSTVSEVSQTSNPDHSKMQTPTPRTGGVSPLPSTNDHEVDDVAAIDATGRKFDSQLDTVSEVGDEGYYDDKYEEGTAEEAGKQARTDEDDPGYYSDEDDDRHDGGGENYNEAVDDDGREEVEAVDDVDGEGEMVHGEDEAADEDAEVNGHEWDQESEIGRDGELAPDGTDQQSDSGLVSSPTVNVPPSAPLDAVEMKYLDEAKRAAIAGVAPYPKRKLSGSLDAGNTSPALQTVSPNMTDTTSIPTSVPTPSATTMTRRSLDADDADLPATGSFDPIPEVTEEEEDGDIQYDEESDGDSGDNVSDYVNRVAAQATSPENSAYDSRNLNSYEEAQDVSVSDYGTGSNQYPLDDVDDAYLSTEVGGDDESGAFESSNPQTDENRAILSTEIAPESPASTLSGDAEAEDDAEYGTYDDENDKSYAEEAVQTGSILLGSSSTDDATLHLSPIPTVPTLLPTVSSVTSSSSAKDTNV